MRKTLILVSISILFWTAVKAQTDSSWVSIKGYSIEVNELKHDFGTIEQNSRSVFKFELRNTGDNALVIKHVTTSCGCTTTNFTKRPMEPGKTGKIKVNYDSSKTGRFSKSVFVYTNFDEKPIKLGVEGVVIPSGSNKSAQENSVKKKEVSFKGKIPQNQ